MDTLNEKSDYKATVNAFKALGFVEQEINTIWSIIASILHLGNVNFKSKLTIIK